MKNENKQYICTRPKLYSFLVERGFIPKSVAAHFTIPNYHVWIYDRTPELMSAIDEFFNNLNK